MSERKCIPYERWARENDEFLNQVEFYLEHNRRAFSYYDFHNNTPSCQEELKFATKLAIALDVAGFEVVGVQEIFPATYIVSKKNE